MGNVVIQSKVIEYMLNIFLVSDHHHIDQAVIEYIHRGFQHDNGPLLKVFSELEDQESRGCANTEQNQQKCYVDKFVFECPEHIRFPCFE
jgi:hypothetical protein